MSESKSGAEQVGAVVKVKAGTEVTRPDGRVHVVDGDSYVLDAAGVHVVGGKDVEVK